eukprot:4481590-Amphidinium_carterae.1
MQQLPLTLACLLLSPYSLFKSLTAVCNECKQCLQPSATCVHKGSICQSMHGDHELRLSRRLSKAFNPRTLLIRKELDFDRKRKLRKVFCVFLRCGRMVCSGLCRKTPKVGDIFAFGCAAFSTEPALTSESDGRPAQFGKIGVPKKTIASTSSCKPNIRGFCHYLFSL